MFRFLRNKRSWVDAETLHTPLEVAADRAAWRHVFKTDDVPPAAHIKRYQRSDVTPDIRLYSAGLGARTLVVALCGRTRRVMIPVATMLQNMDDRSHDLLILADPLKLHYDRGVGDFADSMPALALRIKSIASERGYATLITYGISMGGLPALRIGALLGASRAISCGGLFPWHINRLLDGQHTIGAFDLLCDCRPASAAPSYLLFSNGVQEDVDAATRVSTIMPGVVQVPIPCHEHNFVVRMSWQGNTAEYFRRLFDLDREPDVARLATTAAH